MNTHTTNSAAQSVSGAVGLPVDDCRVVAALEEYIHLIRVGEKPGRTDFLARHRAIAEDLAHHLDDLEIVEGAVGGLGATGSFAGSMDDPKLPARLGEYRIIREVGRGGMGIVYEAEQLPLGRRVALKVLPSTTSLDARQRQRFQVEAQAAALLHHEHIVPVFDIGCDQGVHYYAMQFIDGRSLTEVIGRLRPSDEQAAVVEYPNSHESSSLAGATAAARAAKSAGSSLNNRRQCQAAAQLGVQAALALEHAHEIGVIHRDIKPSNLLIDSRDHLWVADFGLARLPHADHDLTRTGDLVGTLRYMSPEQVRGDRDVVDARTDIYALGVTLYELLTLRPAFDARNRNELVRRIIDEEPVRPRRFNPAVPRDLETIIFKAIEKEPAARYDSARAFADDLRRFLNDQPIQARRPSLVDRAVKWSRRRRPAVVAAIGALFVTLAASTVVLWEAKRRTDATLVKYTTAREVQQLAIQKALGALEQFTQPIARNAEWKTRPEAAQALRVAMSYCDDLTRIFADDAGMREVRAKAFRQAGLARLSLGTARGRDDYRQAIRGFEELVKDFPDRIWYRTRLIETLEEYAGLLTAPADKQEADGAFRRAVGVAAPLIGDAAAGQHCFRIGLVGPYNSLAWQLVRCPTVCSSDASLAIRLARQAVDWAPEQAAFWNTLGVAHYRAGDWSAAAVALQRSMELSHGGNAIDWFFMACIKSRQGKTREAIALYDQAVAWMHRNPIKDKAQASELDGFRGEAAKLLCLVAAS
jgi:serine/threonine protein kinase